MGRQKVKPAARSPISRDSTVRDEAMVPATDGVTAQSELKLGKVGFLWPRGDVWRPLLVVAVLSGVLGFSFNSVNPLGVRISTKPVYERGPIASAPSDSLAVKNSVLEPVGSGAQISALPIHGVVDEKTDALPTISPLARIPVTGVFTNPSPILWADAKIQLAAGRIILVDAREPAHFEAGHIPGAISLSVFAKNEEFTKFQRTYATNVSIVTYCGSAQCPWGHHLADRLANEFGYSHVQWLATGYIEWQSEEGGVVPLPRNPTLVSWASVAKEVEGDQVLLVDARALVDFVRDRIPTAVSLPSTVSTAELFRFKNQHGTGRKILVYGDFSGSSSVFQFATRLLRECGFQTVQVLREGFDEWREQQNSKK